MIFTFLKQYIHILIWYITIISLFILQNVAIQARNPFHHVHFIHLYLFPQVKEEEFQEHEVTERTLRRSAATKLTDPGSWADGPPNVSDWTWVPLKTRHFSHH